MSIINIHMIISSSVIARRDAAPEDQGHARDAEQGAERAQGAETGAAAGAHGGALRGVAPREKMSRATSSSQSRPSRCATGTLGHDHSNREVASNIDVYVCFSYVSFVLFIPCSFWRLQVILEPVRSVSD